MGGSWLGNQTAKPPPLQSHESGIWYRKQADAYFETGLKST